MSTVNNLEKDVRKKALSKNSDQSIFIAKSETAAQKGGKP